MYERTETHDDYTAVPLDPNDLFFVELASEDRLVFRPKSAYAASVLERWASGVVEAGALWTLPDRRAGGETVGKLTLYFRQRAKDLPLPSFIIPTTTDGGWMQGALAEGDNTVRRAVMEGEKIAREISRAEIAATDARPKRRPRPRRRGAAPAEIAARLGELSTEIPKRTSKPKRKYSRRKPKGRIVNASALKQPRRRR